MAAKEAKVLVVSKDVALQSAFKERLEMHGCRVFIANDCAHASVIVGKEAFHALVIEPKVFGRNGFMIAKMVRSSTLNAKAALYVITDSEDADLTQRMQPATTPRQY